MRVDISLSLFTIEEQIIEDCAPVSIRAQYEFPFKVTLTNKRII